MPPRGAAKQLSVSSFFKPANPEQLAAQQARDSERISANAKENQEKRQRHAELNPARPVGRPTKLLKLAPQQQDEHLAFAQTAGLRLHISAHLESSNLGK